MWSTQTILRESIPTVSELKGICTTYGFSHSLSKKGDIYKLLVRDCVHDIAEEIEDADVRLFALGVGTETGSKIQTSRGYKRNQQQEEVGNILCTQQHGVISDELIGVIF